MISTHHEHRDNLPWMAHANAPGSFPFTPSAHQPLHHAPRGTKRPADSSLESEQRLSKRFDLLNLDAKGTRLYIPVPGSSTTHPIPPPTNITSTSTSSAPLAALPQGDGMRIDDTPHRIYISDLSAEISPPPSPSLKPLTTNYHHSSSPIPGGPIFLPEIDAHLSRIPAHILRPAVPETQLVLYSVPSSLSVPAERDGVRRAIVDARRRIRERQSGGSEGVGKGAECRKREGVEVDLLGLEGESVEVLQRQGQRAEEEDDPDAMELD